MKRIARSCTIACLSCWMQVVMLLLTLIVILRLISLDVARMVGA